MTTCSANSDPRTRAIVRGCVIVIVALAALLGGCFVVAAIPGTVGAQAVVCTPVADAVLLPGYAVNIRPEPNTNGAPVGGIRDQTPRPVEGQSGAWLKLCGGGWVSAQYFGITPRPTATPTRVVVIQTATPTRIRHNFIWCVAGSVTQTAASGQVFVECSAP